MMFSCTATTTLTSLRTVAELSNQSSTQTLSFPRTDTADSETTLVDILHTLRRTGSQETLVNFQRVANMTNARDEVPADMHTVTTAEAMVAIVDEDRPTSFGRGGAGNIR